MRNRFDRDLLRTVWAFRFRCLWCGESGFDAFHHIMSPSSPRYKYGRFNSSILNACPIHNFQCHLYNAELHEKESEKKLLKKVYQILKKEGYVFTKKDKKFQSTYRDLYLDEKQERS